MYMMTKGKKLRLLGSQTIFMNCRKCGRRFDGADVKKMKKLYSLHMEIIHNIKHIPVESDFNYNMNYNTGTHKLEADKNSINKTLLGFDENWDGYRKIN